MAQAIYLLSLALGVFAISAAVAIVTFAIGGIVASVALTVPTVLLLSFAVSWLDAAVSKAHDEETQQ